jgi:hypothetical protein
LLLELGGRLFVCLCQPLNAGFAPFALSRLTALAVTCAELFVSAEGSTWTMIISWPHGFSCIVAEGHNWVDWEEPDPEV